MKQQFLYSDYDNPKSEADSFAAQKRVRHVAVVKKILNGYEVFWDKHSQGFATEGEAKTFREKQRALGCSAFQLIENKLPNAKKKWIIKWLMPAK